jgi:hypothetical protein
VDNSTNADSKRRWAEYMQKWEGRNIKKQTGHFRKKNLNRNNCNCDGKK